MAVLKIDKEQIRLSFEKKKKVPMLPLEKNVFVEIGFINTHILDASLWYVSGTWIENEKKVLFEGYYNHKNSVFEYSDLYNLEASTY